jgi:hypothetical protein
VSICYWAIYPFALSIFVVNSLILFVFCVQQSVELEPVPNPTIAEAAPKVLARGGTYLSPEPRPAAAPNVDLPVILAPSIEAVFVYDE